MKNLVKMPFFRLALLVLVVVILGLLLKKYVANRERFFNPQNCPYDVDSFIGKTQTIITLNIKKTSDTANKQIDLKSVEDSNNPKLQLKYRIYDEGTADDAKGTFINIESLEYKTKQNTDGNTEIESIKVNDISIKIYKRTLNDGGNSCIDSHNDENIFTTIEDSDDESKSINKLFTYLVDFFTLTNDTYEETQLKKFKLYDPEKKTDGTDEDHVSFSIIVKKKNGDTFEDKLSKLTFVNKLEKLSGYTNVYAVNPTFSIHVLDIGSPLVFGTNSNTSSTTKGNVTKTDNTSTDLSIDSDNSIITFNGEQYKHLTEYGNIIDYINNIKLLHTDIDPKQIRAASEICKRCYQTNSGCSYQSKHQPPGTSQTVTTNMGCIFENANSPNDPIIFRCNVCGDITDSLDDEKATIFTIADKNDSDTKKNFLSTMPYASSTDITKLLDFLKQDADITTYNNLNLSNTLSVIGGNTNQGGSGTSGSTGGSGTSGSTGGSSSGSTGGSTGGSSSGSTGGSTGGSGTSGSTGGSANNSTFLRSLRNLKTIMNQKLGVASPTISNNEVTSSINVVNKLEELLDNSEIQQVSAFRNFSYSGGITSPAPFDTSFSPTTGNSSVSEFSNYRNFL